jgi:drug/metabolite transporter (DMT)-like permease
VTKVYDLAEFVQDSIASVRDAIIIGGLLAIGASALMRQGIGGIHRKGVAIALALAVLISIYTVIDGAAVKRGPALPYAFLIFTFVPLPLTPFVLRQYGWPSLRKTWLAQRLRLLLAGVLGIAAYLCALAAYSIAPLNYSGAIREVSVVIGAFAGWKILGERLGSVRLLGAAVIFAGILVIAQMG